MPIDRLSSEVRAAERMVDGAFRTNALVGVPRAQAMWTLLGVVDDAGLLPRLGSPHTHQQTQARLDALVNHASHPLRWLSESAPAGSVVSHTYDASAYQAAHDLLELGRNYDPFVTVFTLASNGFVGLDIRGSELVVEHSLSDFIRFEAYNRLIQRRFEPEPAVGGVAFQAMVDRRTRTRGTRFSVTPTPAEFQLAMREVAPAFERRFRVPGSWSFTRYGLADVRRVYHVLFAWALIRTMARTIAVGRGILGMGYPDAVIVSSVRDLVAKVIRFGGCGAGVASAVISDLTLGNCGIRHPDVALQPLVPLDSETIAFSPQLLLALSAERNHLVLLNRIPAERASYSRYVNEKEGELRSDLTFRLPADLFRTWHGPLAGASDLPDVDLAIISDTEKECLVCELKWFIAPAEVAEGLHRDEEISKGMKQAASIAWALRASPSLRNRLGLPPGCQISSVVISEDWIGHRSPALRTSPVIQAAHFSRQFARLASLRKLREWLANDGHLPVENRDFSVVTTTNTVGGISLAWYGIRPLVSGEFDPR